MGEEKFEGGGLKMCLGVKDRNVGVGGGKGV